MTHKLIVQFFMHEGKIIAEHINPRNGKVFYFNADLVAKKVMINSKSKYKVVIRKGRCVRLICQQHQKSSKWVDVREKLNVLLFGT